MDFQYVARTKAGVIQKDVMQALNERAVVDALRAQGLMPTSVKPIEKAFDINHLFEFLRPIKLIDRITFIKNLGVMIKAGLPATRSLKVLAAQTPNPRFAKIVNEVASQVESGTSLADSMAKFPNVFSAIFVSMVRAGEASGNLEQDLNYLAEQMQRDYDLVSKVRGAMTYPIMVLIALVIVAFFMFTFVLPNLIASFTSMNVPLPLMTRIVIDLVNIFSHFGIIILILVVMLVVAFIYWRRTISGKKVLHKLVLYTPIMSGIVIKINLARFLRVFSSLIKSGMPIVEGLEVSSRVVGNIYYQQVIFDAASKVKIGQPLTTSFKKQPKLFTNLVIQMMEVGEESGTTDTVLEEVANFYEQEVDNTMKNLSAILEPLIMMVIGVAVGFLAVAIIAPIYNIGQTIS